MNHDEYQRGCKMSLLEVKNLNVFYGNIHAIKDVSLEVDKGEIVSLIGANGAGKTTTLQTISGIIRSKSGEIVYNGKDITKTKAYLILKEGIAQVPEGRRIFAHLTVYDNLMLGGYSIKDSAQNKKREIEEIYKKLPRLEERKNQLAGTLSGGEQQMLAIGRAIMSRPQILILDEPSMGLSPLLVKEIFEIIKELNKNNGTTVLLVEQNAKMALGISDRAYVLETGKIIKTGPAKDLLNDDIVRKAYLGA
jgi:high affinity branched-chain amino acid ABC transporter, ATP-binding protein